MRGVSRWLRVVSYWILDTRCSILVIGVAGYGLCVAGCFAGDDTLIFECRFSIFGKEAFGCKADFVHVNTFTKF